MYDGSKAYFKNYEILDNEDIILEICNKCDKVTYHKIVYGTDFYSNRLKQISKFCLRCKDE